MTCEHCSRAVTAELNSLTGVTGVRVDLVPDGRSAVLVVSEVPLDVQAVDLGGMAGKHVLHVAVAGHRPSLAPAHRPPPLRTRARIRPRRG